MGKPLLGERHLVHLLAAAGQARQRTSLQTRWHTPLTALKPNLHSAHLPSGRQVRQLAARQRRQAPLGAVYTVLPAPSNSRHRVHTPWGVQNRHRGGHLRGGGGAGKADRGDVPLALGATGRNTSGAGLLRLGCGNVAAVLPGHFCRMPAGGYQAAAAIHDCMHVAAAGRRSLLARRLRRRGSRVGTRQRVGAEGAGGGSGGEQVAACGGGVGAVVRQLVGCGGVEMQPGLQEGSVQGCREEHARMLDG